MDSAAQAQLQEGTVIPASPLALTKDREWSSQHQRALTRYYYDAGAGGIAVGVHTTQFAIRDHKLYEPVPGTTVKKSVLLLISFFQFSTS